MDKDYYDIACQDFLYFSDVKDTPHYNNHAVTIQQISEKLLKSVAERSCVDENDYRKSHNLRKIYHAIGDDDFLLNAPDLAFLSDFYFDARYPGDDYVDVDKNTFDLCREILTTIIKEVNYFRERHNLPIHQCFKPFGLPERLSEEASLGETDISSAHPIQPPPI